MSEAQPSARRQRYLVHPRSQMGSVWPVLGVLVAIAALEAGALVVLSGQAEHGSRSLTSSLPLLLAVHAVSCAFGAAVLFWTMVRITHRYAGPAHLIRQALAGMRKGEYGYRLKPRSADYLHELAAEVLALREEIAKRDILHARTMHQLERALEEHDEPVVLESLRRLGSSMPSVPARGTAFEHLTA